MKKLKFFMKEKNRLIAWTLAAVMALSGVPTIPAQAADSTTPAPGTVTTVHDPETLHRPIDIYGQNTLNGGKITVGKSVDTTGFENDLLDGVSTGGLTPATNNFLVTLSQSAQAVGLASKLPVPVDAVFVLDTSGSMADPEDDPRYVNMINAANEAINALLSANEQNRIAVVAFSSEDYGRGTSGDAAANVLSSLAHYTGDAATAHLQRVNQYGQANSSGTFVAGRSTVTNATIEVQWGNNTYNQSYSGNAFRKAQEGGTNIQAGIALGASILMAEKITTALVDDRTVTRLPFIIVLSDGNPTYSSTAEKWYDADSIGTAGQQGPGRNPYPGNGFLAAMTAAYYKGAITEHYFGNYANEDNHCNIYTVGVDLQSDMSASETALAEITLNPAEEYTRTNTWYNRFKDYWDSYNSGNAFEVNVGGREPAGWDYRYFDVFFDISKASITATKNYVNGKNKDGVSMYTGGLGYNDEYFATSGSSSGLKDTFKELVRLIQIKAISLPTDTSVSADFGGYVHFYDPIGEYMEVKDVHGIVADGYFFQGASFAKNMVNYGTGANDAFDTAITEALNGRLELSESGKLDETAIKAIVDAAKQADGQLYYNSNSDYENSFCWWGSAYTNQTTGDEHVQFLGFAGDDSIEYIKSATAPADADYVCRSYYYYGTAGGTIEPIDDFLLMVIRVQRSLVAPYQETVYVSIPGNLLSVDRVLITEDKTVSPSTWESFVQAENPVRIIYEVGLQSDINAQNVAQKLAGTAYVAEKTNKSVVGNSKDNYEASEDTYYFYTNDWDRSKSGENHERALAHAGFDVAEDNDFYAFLEDTLLYTDKNGTPATSLTTGTTYYYKRPYYEWTNATAKNEEKTLFACTPKETYIAVKAPSQDVIDKFATKKEGQWYVKAGTYTAYSLSAANDDTIKVDANDNPANNTGTSTIVAHPMRANAINDSHYVVYLGNNGRLALTADKTKDVTITRPAKDTQSAPTIINKADGELVTVGDVLTYTMKVVNEEDTIANAVVTDKVPAGTKLVEDSISFEANGTGATATNSIDANGNITWNIQNLPVNGMVYVSFKAEVTTDALSQEVITIDNQATIQIGNNPAYTTNKVENPPQGKLSQGTDGTVNPETLKVGDELTYRINYYNNEDTAATITITDIIPAGTTYMEGSATHADNNSTNESFGISTVDGETVLTWTLTNVQANTAGYVSFKVKVNESAKTPVENGATIAIGGNSYTTNTTSADVLTGDLKLTKTVQGTGGDTDKEFTLVLTSKGATNNEYVGLTRTFDATRYTNVSASGITNGTAITNGVTFTDGVASVTIKHDEAVIIHDLPANLSLNVTETAAAGYIPTYNGGQIVVIKAGEVNAAAEGTDVVNTYVATPYEFQLHGTKVLDTDEYFTDANFVFEVYRYVDSSQPWTGDVEFATSADATVSSTNKTAEFHFAERTFTVEDVGTHYYKIKEKDPKGTNKISGVTYDNIVYYLKLVVSNDGNGAINVVPSIYKEENGEKVLIADNGDTSATNDITNETIKFTNEYDTATIQLHGTKVLKNKNLEAGQFAFEVLDESNNVVSRGQNATDGTITFTPITYTQTGTHNYVVSEVDGKLANYGYDATKYNVTVVVNEVNGKLQATVSGADAITFTNYFVPQSVSFDLAGTKILDNRSGDASLNLKAGQFTFEVIDANDKVVSSGTNDAAGNIDFDLITISANSATDYENGVTYTYKVKEVIPTGGAKDPYMNYHEDEIAISVTVTVDKTTGKLVATLNSNNPEIKFTNVQYPSSVQVTPVGNKVTLNSAGVSADLPNSTFSFHVVDVDTGEEATVGVGAANGAIAFRPITYTTPNTSYQYWIKESNAGSGSNAINYATNRYLMKVEVKSDMTVDVKYFGINNSSSDVTDVNEYTTEITNTTKIIFTNKYHATGQLNITAKKALVDKTMQKDGEFAFKLLPVNSAYEPIGGEIDGISYTDGTVKFATLYYASGDLNSAGEQTLYYKMSEFIPTTNKTPGITYDKSEYILTVKLTGNTNGITTTLVSVKQIKDASGNVVANPTEDTLNNSGATGVTFTNTYKAVKGTHATITAKKELTGRALTADDKFIFNLYYVDYATNTETLVATTTNDAKGDISFTRNYLPNAIDFAGADTKTYTYVIREEVGNLGGVNYNPAQATYWVTVTIKNDKTNAELVIDSIKYYSNAAKTQESMVLENNVKFINTYTVQGTSFPLTGWKKELQNRPLFDNEFAFEVRTDDAENKLVSTGLAKADGSIGFTPIALNVAGEHKYVISETSGQIAGVNYADTKYYLKINVTDNGAGDLVVSESKYYSDNQYTDATEITDLTKLVFTNTYTVHRITVPVEATKVLNGRDLKDNEFDFVLLDKPKSDSDAAVIARADNVASTDPTKPDNVVFTLNYEYNEDNHGEAQTYVYYMSEVAPLDGHAGGVKIDDKEYVVVVTISHDEANAKLKADVKYYTEYTDANNNTPLTGGVPAFVNTYITTPAEVSVNAQKFLTGKQLAAEEFEFVVYESDANGTTGAQIASVKNDASGIVKLFDKKQFTATKTYYYKVKEGANATELKNADGKVIGTYSNDPTEYIIKVDVVDDLLGKLHATTTYYKAGTEVAGISFTNGYTPASLVTDLSTDIEATKTVTSPNGYTLKDGEFTFEVKDVYGNPVIGENGKVVTGVNKANGEIVFDNFVFTQPGEYRYWISEVVDTTKEAYMTYDARNWEVHVTVSYAYNDILVENSSEVLYPAGTLYIAKDGVKTYASSRALDEEKPAFVNNYNPLPVTITITADKQLTVPEGSGRKLQAHEFTFRVKDEHGIIRAESQNDADGNITFSFTESVAGEHTYTVVEFVPAVNAGGIDYDRDTKAVIEVTVVDDGNGQLKIENAASITKENVAVFKNTYNPSPAPAIISAKKVLHNAELTANAFEFELVDANGKVAATATNDATGNITFAPQMFDKAGEYQYSIREVKGNIEHVTYDTTEFTVKVVVEDNLMGNLVANVEYQSEPVFENTYTPPTPNPGVPAEPDPEPGDEHKIHIFTKIWDDNNNAAGKRPSSIMVSLYCNGIYASDIELCEANNWTCGLILMSINDGEEVVWTIEEKNVPAGYTASYNQETHTVTNTYVGSVSANGTKTGDDSNLALFGIIAVVALIALAGIAVLLIKFKKKDEHEE